MIIIQKLRKDDELLAQELVREVHCRIHDTNTMCANGVGNVRDVDCVDCFVGCVALYKYLIVQIVVIPRYEDVNVAHDF